MATLAYGFRRVVLVVPRLGLVFKFPRIRFTAIESILRAYRMRKHGEPRLMFFKRLWRLRKNFLKVFWDGLWDGVRDNLRERSYFKHSSVPARLLLQPTYLSLLGFLNIQRFGSPLGARESELGTALYRQLYPIVGQSITLDGHHWSNASNFHVENGSLKVLDYGSKRTQDILGSFGLEILRRFDADSLLRK